MQMGKCLTWEDHWAASWKNLTSFHSTPSMRTAEIKPPERPARWAEAQHSLQGLMARDGQTPGRRMPVPTGPEGGGPAGLSSCHLPSPHSEPPAEATSP